MKEVYNFKEVEVSKNNAYLQPGFYTLTVRKAEYVKPEGKKPDGVTPKTPYLEITFGGDAGEIGVKFYITPKAVDRLQTIYTNWFDQKCDKAFDSSDAVGAFFEKAFSSDKAKKTMKRMAIGGKQATNGKVYAELPFSNYIIPDNVENFVEGAFEVNSIKWIQYVKMNPANPSSNTDAIMIATPSASDDFADDLPF